MGGYNDPESGYVDQAPGLFTHLGHVTDITNRFDKDDTPADGDVWTYSTADSLYHPDAISGGGSSTAVVVTDAPYNAVGNGSTNDTAAIQAALDSGKDVYLPGPATYSVTSVNVNTLRQTIYAGTSAVLQGRGGAGSEILKLNGDFSRAFNVVVTGIAGDGTGIATYGFRNFVFDCKVNGVLTADALAARALETSVIMGKFGGAAGAGIRAYDDDLYMANVYLELNGYGFYSNGIGSITAHHIHAAKNTNDGFYLETAAYSQFTDCHADTNGHHGFQLKVMQGGGLSLVDCWSFKNSNGAAGYADYYFRYVNHVRLFGCRSSNTGPNGFAKSASYDFDPTCQVDLIGCHATQDPTSATGGNINFSHCSGNLQRFNRASHESMGGPYTVNSSSTVAATVRMPVMALSTTPGVRAFEVTAIIRDTDNAGAAVERWILMFGTSATVPAVTAVFPASPTLSLSSTGMTADVNSTAYYNLTFTVTNSVAKQRELAFNVRHLGTGKAFL